MRYKRLNVHGGLMSSARTNMTLLSPVPLGLFLLVSVAAVRIAPPLSSSTNRSLDEQVWETDVHSNAPCDHSEMAGCTKHRGHCPRNCSHRAVRNSLIRTEQPRRTDAPENKPLEDAERAYGMWTNLMQTVGALWKTVGKLFHHDVIDNDTEN
ncbi:uncharacterized protein DEA37_0011533 [Paragonimus westermani]|uniref:Uncharacterized protein n=1 Tax=Paragonimus westermani TaxID=34504 RepID=A0A5J4N815_9TREM|nr:uncharacterized protein DEA37_0011533 [Paragonimus westermani]